jgi:hypothetical protein|tara:strand:+ start:2953 stop:3138 length:186 start_codon:yes stop_codon:yes gene_type:complete
MDKGVSQAGSLFQDKAGFQRVIRQTALLSPPITRALRPGPGLALKRREIPHLSQVAAGLAV